MLFISTLHCHHVNQLPFESHQDCGSSSILKEFAIKCGYHGNAVSRKTWKMSCTSTPQGHYVHYILLNHMKMVEVIPSTRFWQKKWLPWQRIIWQMQKACLAHLYFRMVMCANFHLNWTKNVEVVPPTRFCNGLLTRSLREPGEPCTKSMEVSESRMERVKPTTQLTDRTLTPIQGGPERTERSIQSIFRTLL